MGVGWGEGEVGNGSGSGRYDEVMNLPIDGDGHQGVDGGSDRHTLQVWHCLAHEPTKDPGYGEEGKDNRG